MGERGRNFRNFGGMLCRGTRAAAIASAALTTSAVLPVVTPVWSTAGAAAVASVLLASTHARADEAIAGDMWVGNALFTIDDLDLLEEVCELTPEQQGYAKELLKGVRLKSRGVRKRWERSWEDMSEQASIESQLADGSLYASDPARAAQLATRLTDIEAQWFEAMERLESLSNG